MQIVYKTIDELKPYKRNPRNNDGAVDAVATSIKEFGFKIPNSDRNQIIIDDKSNKAIVDILRGAINIDLITGELNGLESDE